MTFYLDNIFYQHSRGSDPIINNLSLTLCPGPMLLLGRNGAGKTTLLRLAAGLLKPKSGKIHRPGRVFYLPQKFVSVPGFTCLEYVSHLVAPRPGQAVVEIGPGLAALTQPLLQRLGRLTVIELDRDLAGVPEGKP